MFSAKAKSRFAGLMLAGAVLAAPVAAMAGVVVKSTGPSSSKYPVGAKVDDNATITLKAGDSVTVLTSKGTKVMKGAGSFKVGDKPKATRARFAALTRTRNANRVRTGAVRGTGAASKPTNPNLWYVDVTQSGTICLTDTTEVRLWRPSTEGIATYNVADGNSGASVDVTFDESESVAPLDPAILSITTGTPYSVTGPGQGEAQVTITFAKLDQEYTQADQLAEALVAAGCMTQINQMADRLAG